jgi:hypothetical protein
MTRDEDEWFERAYKLIDKYEYHEKFDSEVWTATVSAIFRSLCEKANDESWEDNYLSILEELDYDFLKSADNHQIGLSIEEIQQYMNENDLSEVTSQDFIQMRQYFYDEIKDRLSDKLFEEYYDCKALFAQALENEYGDKTILKLFFFYVRESRLSDALELYDGGGDLLAFNEEQDEIEDWDDIELKEDKSDHDIHTPTPKEPILYSFIEGNALDYPNINIIFEWIENDLFD